MTLPPELLALSPEEGARLVALARLEATRAAAARLGDPRDAEALHDFRVALRRLRGALRAGRGPLDPIVPSGSRRALRSLQRATGAGRDAEVILAWLADQRASLARDHEPGLEWLTDRLEAGLERALQETRTRVAADFARAAKTLQRALETLSLEMHLHRHRPGVRFGAFVAERARREARRVAKLLGGLRSAEDTEPAHRARIAVKHLRYLLEPVRGRARKARGLVERCKELQDHLGEMQDAHVLRAELGRAAPEAAAEHARRLHGLARRGDPAALARAEADRALPGLVELAARSQQRLEEAFAALRARWLGKRLARFLDDVEALARRLEEPPGRDVEIERKYLLRALPSLEGDGRALDVEQGWLPGEPSPERLRRQRGPDGTRYFRTVKRGRGVARTEIEEPTTRAVFELLWPLTAGCRIHKRRHVVRAGGHVWEIDDFLDRDLVLAEVELRDPSEHPEPPAWLAPHVVREVTDDPAYTNLALARTGSA